MPIQILGLRDNISKQGKKEKSTRFFGKGWSLPKIEDVFSPDKIKKVLAKIPESERWNLYFTVAECVKEREIDKQLAIPFDVDWVECSPDLTQEQVTLHIRKVLASTLPESPPGASPSNIAALWSGHGVQLFVLLEEPLTSKKEFSEYSASYKKLCKIFEKNLRDSGVKFRDVDTTVFSHARLMRLPYTTNKKDGCEDAESFLVGDFEPMYFPMFLEKETLRKEHVLNDTVLKSYPKPDTKGVLAGCDFLKWCKTNQNEVTEPQWYAMLSVVSRLESGPILCHEYSKDHKDYDEHKTETKLEQALTSAGPRTCEGIDSIWGKCSGCPHYQSNEIRSPIMIKGEDYIATESIGFRRIIMDKNGNQRLGKLEYDDLVKAFVRDFNYKAQCTGDGVASVLFWKYEEDYWTRLNRGHIGVWIESKVENLTSNEHNEFVSKLARNNMLHDDFFENSNLNYKQFKNCVLDMRTGAILTPSSELGITHVIPHVFNEGATCPLWDKFLDGICQSSQGKIDNMNEFLGDILFSKDNRRAKALMLVGSGGNGKSVYIDVVKAVVGERNYSSVRIENSMHEYNIAELDNKLLNACGEVSYKAFKDSAGFKELVAGGKIMGRMIRGEPRTCNIRAKFILSFNTIPTVYDTSEGFGRRPLVINLNKRFDNTDECDHNLTEKLIAETPGIINKALKSYRKLEERKRYLETEEILADKEALLRGANSITDFVAEYFDRADEETFVKSSVIMDMVKQYCSNENIDERNFHMKRISSEFKKRFGVDSAGFKKINKKSHRVYFGIKIKDDIDLEINEEF